MFEKLYYGGMIAMLVICMVISTVFSLLIIGGAFDEEFILENIGGVIVIFLFVIAELVLLFLRVRHDKRKMILSISTVLALIALALTPGIAKDLKKERMYKEVFPLIEQGKYNQALEVLDEYDEDEYPSCASLKYLCWAHINYEEGNLEVADNDALFYLYYTESDEMPEAEKAFAIAVQKEYEEQQRQIKEQKEAAEKAHREMIRNGVPFIGMSESEIDNTALGEHYGSPVFEGAYIYGEWHDNIRRYGFEYGREIIFVVYCEDGKVIKTEDKLYRLPSGVALQDIISTRPNFSNSSSSKSSKSSSGSSFNGNTYYDAEDFYDDYYDEFDSYEDAEEYFYDYVY